MLHTNAANALHGARAHANGRSDIHVTKGPTKTIFTGQQQNPFMTLRQNRSLPTLKDSSQLKALLIGEFDAILFRHSLRI